MSEPIAATAPIATVTVLEDRAAVTRRCRLAIGAGQHRIVVDGVSPVIADKTLTAVATGARVLDVRCERFLAPWRDPSGGDRSDVTRLEAERRELAAACDAARGLADVARAESEAMGALTAAALSDLAVAASRGVAVASAVQRLAELDAADAAARVRGIDAEIDVASAAAALDRLDDRLARAEAEAGEQAARLVIDVLAEQPADIALAIGYVVPGAAWRPYHRAVLARGAKPEVQWQTTACVWQATGEDWTDAELAFSLERPSLGVEPPDLADDELRARRKPDAVTVEARDHEHRTTGLGGGPLEVPGIDDGGLGLKLSGGRATVRCDGAPHRVSIGGFATAAQLSLVAIPLRSPWVHLRARLVNTSASPLLAGPVDLIMASGYVGRAEVGFVAAGEKFHLGFGPDADIRAHRTETRQRDDAGLLGGWNVQTVRVAVRLSNLGTEAREVTVTERIPVSEVEQVEIEVGAPDAYLLGTDDHPGGEEITQVTARAFGERSEAMGGGDPAGRAGGAGGKAPRGEAERGLVTWSVELPPAGRRAVTLEYKVKSQRGVAGV